MSFSSFSTGAMISSKGAWIVQSQPCQPSSTTQTLVFHKAPEKVNEIRNISSFQSYVCHTTASKEPETEDQLTIQTVSSIEAAISTIKEFKRESQLIEKSSEEPTVPSLVTVQESREVTKESSSTFYVGPKEFSLTSQDLTSYNRQNLSLDLPQSTFSSTFYLPHPAAPVSAEQTSASVPVLTNRVQENKENIPKINFTEIPIKLSVSRRTSSCSSTEYPSQLTASDPQVSFQSSRDSYPTILPRRLSNPKVYLDLNNFTSKKVPVTTEVSLVSLDTEKNDPISTSPNLISSPLIPPSPPCSTQVITIPIQHHSEPPVPATPVYYETPCVAQTKVMFQIVC